MLITITSINIIGTIEQKNYRNYALMRDWFILVPALIPTGPIKGAIALANKISKDRRVNLVYLKEGSGASTFIDPRIKIISLAEKTFLVS